VSNLSLSHLTNGDFQQALDEARRLREIQPDWSTGLLLEGMALYHAGRPTEAVSVLDGLVVEWAGSGPQVTAALARAAAGDAAGARSALAGFERDDDWFAAGLVHLALGDRGSAFDRFRRVTEWSYWPTLSLHHFYPELLAPLRSDALYQQMITAMERSWAVESSGPALDHATHALEPTERDRPASI
jgi:tetratricopeptide (TPR) repeat protein